MFWEHTGSCAVNAHCCDVAHFMITVYLFIFFFMIFFPLINTSPSLYLSVIGMGLQS